MRRYIRDGFAFQEFVQEAKGCLNDGEGYDAVYEVHEQLYRPWLDFILESKDLWG